ncbi:MAG: histidine triad nucleotide-binding protein [Acidaminococcaceae bacterium]
MSDCIFCKIIAGEIPSTKLYEDDKMLVINDVAPGAPVHVLLIPKVHTQNIVTADSELVAHIMGKLGLLAKLLGVEKKGFRVVINTGVDGGQSVEHLHFHLLGGKELGWPPC